MIVTGKILWRGKKAKGLVAFYIRWTQARGAAPLIVDDTLETGRQYGEQTIASATRDLKWSCGLNE